MDVVGERLHVWKLVVGMDEALRVALALPGVVDVDVDVAGVAHPARYHGVGGLADGLVSHLFGEVVPTVPSHRRCRGERRALRGCGLSEADQRECKRSRRDILQGSKVGASHLALLYTLMNTFGVIFFTAAKRLDKTRGAHVAPA